MTSQLAFLYRRHQRGLRHWWAVLIAPLVVLAGFATAQAAPVCTTNGNQITCTFTYTGTAERWVVPPNATQATFDLYGAQGGGRGQGGRVTAQFAVTPGAVYQINVGGQGGMLGGGFNGGGQGGAGFGGEDGAGGGGASDVRTGSFALADRILVAGGGGGSGGKSYFASGGFGGAGGYPSGENGGDGEERGKPIPGGGGGSQRNGVPIGGIGTGNGGDGGVGVGGNGASDVSSGQGGGGGGGGYGGGGGGAANPRGGDAGSGGGGGSSYGPAGATFENGVRAGNGLVIITYNLESTPPVAAPVQDRPANAYGWNNGNVQVQWRWTDSGSGLDPANCANSTLVTAEGRTELTQTCQDRVGNVGSATYTVQIDKTRPIATPTVSPAANANGWHNSDVTVTWNWTDPVPGTGLAAGLDPANCPAAATSSREGSSTLNNDCADLAANRANQSYPVKMDKSAPVVTITGVGNGASYTLGSVPTAGCNTTDTLSGVATPATLTVTGGNGDGTGSFTATCNGATDLAGNSRSAVTATWTVLPLPAAKIEITGKQQPIANGSSPTLANGTNLGEVAVGSSLDQSFIINNRGNAPLTLNGNPFVAISGVNAADFVVITPPAGTVAAGGNTSFQVRFTPSGAGLRTATLTIANTDSTQNPYTFTIAGAGTASLQPTTQLTQLPGNSQSCGAAAGTYIKNCTISFTLQNSSAEELQIRTYSITNLSSHVYVLNGTPNPGQIGTTVTDRRSVAPGATIQPTFNLGLLTSTSYTIRFKVYGYGGVAAASADDSNGVELGEFEVTIDSAADTLPGAVITATQEFTTAPTVDTPVTTESSLPNKLFLPLIANLAGAAFGPARGLVLLLLGLVISGGLLLRRSRKTSKG